MKNRALHRWGAACLLTATIGGGCHALTSFDARTDRRFQLISSPPSRIYTRPLVLHPGLHPVHGNLAEQLIRAGYRRVTGPAMESGTFAVHPGEWIVGVRAFRHARGFDPGVTVFAPMDAEGRFTSLRDAAGNALSRVRIEPVAIAPLRNSVAAERIPIRRAEVPKVLVDAILVIEDRRYYDHPGVDVRRIIGAAVANLRAGRVAQGGSTITQQLARSAYLSRERTLWRKLREVLIALLLERRHTKDEILEAYLNEIYLGQRGSRSIHGVGLAAEQYFGKRVAELDLSESALLAGLISAPNRQSPFRRPEAARKRRDFVLEQMRDHNHITERMYRNAVESSIQLRPPSPEIRSASYFLDYLRRHVAKRHGNQTLEQGGLSVFTTLDLRLQLLSERVIRQRLKWLEQFFASLRSEDESARLQAALVALEPRTGQLLALVGGRSYVSSQFNRAVDARRQPGSIFKPVVVLAGLARRGERKPSFTLASILQDEPFAIRAVEGNWEPVNHDGRFRGAVTVREALEHSLNVPMVRLGEAVGLGNIISTARRLGIESPLDPLPSLPLGSMEVTLLDMTRAYAVLATGGWRAPVRSTLAVIRPDGSALAPAPLPPLRVFDAPETYLVTSALQGGVDRGTSASLRRLGYRGAVAGKTGTTSNFRDGWFLAYTPELVVGVWVGFDDNRSLGLPGSTVALPIAADFLVGALGNRGGARIRPPAGVERSRIFVERRGHCVGIVEFFLPGSAPRSDCRYAEGSSPRG